MKHSHKKHLRRLRKYRIRKKIAGTSSRPRMSVCFTNQNIYVQFIDDSKGVTLASKSTRDKDIAKGEISHQSNVKSAILLGTLAAEAALKAGLRAVVFDRYGALYHGKVKALADSARSSGLQF